MISSRNTLSPNVFSFRKARSRDMQSLLAERVFSLNLLTMVNSTPHPSRPQTATNCLKSTQETWKTEHLLSQIKPLHNFNQTFIYPQSDSHWRFKCGHRWFTMFGSGFRSVMAPAPRSGGRHNPEARLGRRATALREVQSTYGNA